MSKQPKTKITEGSYSRETNIARGETKLAKTSNTESAPQFGPPKKSTCTTTTMLQVFTPFFHLFGLNFLFSNS